MLVHGSITYHFGVRLEAILDLDVNGSVKRDTAHVCCSACCPYEAFMNGMLIYTHAHQLSHT